MNEITVTFDPDEVFTLSDVARHVGVSAGAVSRWWARNKGKPGVPNDLFTVRGQVFFDLEGFERFVMTYERARAKRGLC